MKHTYTIHTYVHTTKDPIIVYIWQHTCMYYSRHLHLHLWSPGLGSHLPSAVHTAIIFSAGANPELHLKITSAPSVVLRYWLITPFSGTAGSLQLAGWINKVVHHTREINNHAQAATYSVQCAFIMNCKDRALYIYLHFISSLLCMHTFGVPTFHLLTCLIFNVDLSYS